MRKTMVTVLTAVAVVLAGLAVTVPAQATGGKNPAICTLKEYRAVKKNMNPKQVARIMDGRGTRVALDRFVNDPFPRIYITRQYGQYPPPQGEFQRYGVCDIRFEKKPGQKNKKFRVIAKSWNSETDSRVRTFF